MNKTKLIKYNNTKDKNIKRELENELVKDNIKLVHFVIKRYFSWLIVDEEELFQAGSIGLLRAIRHYDINSKTEFSTLAVICIKREIINEVERISRLSVTELNLRKIIVTEYINIKNFKLLINPYKIYNDLKGYYPIDMIKKVINSIIIEKSFEYDNLLNVCNRLEDYVDYDTKLDENKSSRIKSEQKIFKLIDNYSDFYTEDYSNTSINNILVQSSLDKLTEEEKKIVKDYFGINSDRKKLKEITEEINSNNDKSITLAGVALRKNKALKKLHKYIGK